MNERSSLQFHLDFRTGLPTAISGGKIGRSGRQACIALNRERTRGIKEATRPAPSGQPFEADGWHALVTARAAQWGVPLIPLSALGLSFDRDGFFLSKTFRRLGWGAEAIAWEDKEYGCVYKLFEVHPNSALGKKLQIEQDEDGRCRVTHIDSDLDGTMEKLSVLNEAGACLTEIVGLTDSGDYLIAKQPLCFPCSNFLEERSTAAELMNAILPKFSLGREIRVFWIRDQAWCLGDLHENNIMIDAEGVPTIIDALICPVPPLIVRSSGQLAASIERSRALSEGLAVPSDDPFDGISDDEF